jgi:hypothetical protein
MTQIKQLSEFLSAIGKDPRIGPIHIALFTVLFNQWLADDFPDGILIFSYQVMPLAKIASRGTFYKTIKELNEYDYIRYMPCFNRKGSKVFIGN